MNWLDAAIAVILFVAVTIGLVQGLIRQLLSLLALYVAVVLAAQYHHVAGNWLQNFVPSAGLSSRDAIAFIAIFIITEVIVNFLGYKAYQVTRVGRFGVVDHLAGGLVGLLIGSVAVLVFLLVLNYALQSPWYTYENLRTNLALVQEHSALASHFLAIAPVVSESIKPWIPSGLPSLFTAD